MGQNSLFQGGALVSKAPKVSPTGDYKILYLSLRSQEGTCNVEETRFFGGWGGVVLCIILYPAGYANSMQILETLKLHTA